MQLTLSTNEIVTLREKYTHKMDRAFLCALYPQAFQDEQISAENVFDAYAVLLPLLIEKIDLKGHPVEFSQGWLDELTADDYYKLKEAAQEIKRVSTEAGKKNG